MKVGSIARGLDGERIGSPIWIDLGYHLDLDAYGLRLGIGRCTARESGVAPWRFVFQVHVYRWGFSGSVGRDIRNEMRFGRRFA